jgi:hypothetical protein
LLEALRRDGVAYAPWRMSDVQLTELWAFLDGCPVWPNHVASKTPGFPEGSKLLALARCDGEWPMFAPVMDDVVRAPHFFEHALRGYKVARGYFGEPPLLYSLNCFFSQPAASTYNDTHVWHRDGDDRKQLGMFMFGTDVLTVDDGAHLYQGGTHRLLDTDDVDAAHAQMDAELGEAYRNPDPGSVETVTGAGGTFFFEDPSGVHMGVRPRGLRMFAWARWGVSDPPRSYSEWDRLRPVSRELVGNRYPTDPELQRAIHLVVG